jgi:PIN domain nuclease of toxin-antitoxin system
MRLLLDTHIALWAISDDPKLSGSARALITAPENEIVVSAASLWEIAIKHSLGRSNMPVSAADALKWFRESGYRLLAISPEHTVSVESLPLLHTDPFDRILIAQSLHEPLRLLTHDAMVARYSDMVMLV